MASKKKLGGHQSKQWSKGRKFPKGVRPNGKRYKVKFWHDGNITTIKGGFTTMLEAANAHDDARIELGYPVATMNNASRAPDDYRPTKKRKLRKSTSTTGYRGEYFNGFDTSLPSIDFMVKPYILFDLLSMFFLFPFLIFLIREIRGTRNTK
jgi:hypothetical protein